MNTYMGKGTTKKFSKMPTLIGYKCEGDVARTRRSQEFARRNKIYTHEYGKACRLLVVPLRRVRNTFPGVSTEDSRPVKKTGPGELGKCYPEACLLGVGD